MFAIASPEFEDFNVVEHNGQLWAAYCLERVNVAELNCLRSEKSEELSGLYRSAFKVLSDIEINPRQDSLSRFEDIHREIAVLEERARYTHRVVKVPGHDV